MFTIKALYSYKKKKEYVVVIDEKGRIVTFDIKVWLPLAEKALGTDGYNETKAALESGCVVKVYAQ